MSDKLVYVGGYSGFVSDKDLREKFEKFGNIVHINPKVGFGFVEYENANDANDAVSEMNNTEFKGGKIKVEKAKGPKQTKEMTRRSENRVVVDNLPSSLNWYELKDHFKQIGDVMFADIIKDSQGRSKNYGIVEFKYGDDMEKAISKLNNSSFNGSTITVKEDNSPSRRSRSSGHNRSKRYSPYSRRRSSSRRRSKSPQRSSRRSKSPRSRSRSKSPKRHRRRSPSGSPAPKKSKKRSPSRSPSPKKKSSKRSESPKRSPKRSRRDHTPPKGKRSRSRSSRRRSRS